MKNNAEMMTRYSGAEQLEAEATGDQCLTRSFERETAILP